MSDENPIAKLGDLTKPATVLIEKISDAGAPALSMARRDFPVPLAPFGHGA